MPRFDFRECNKERLKKISLSASSLPPVGLFPIEEKSHNIPAITDGAYNFHNSQDNMHDDMYNFYDEVIPPKEKRHHSLEYLDDFYPIDDQELLEDLLDEDVKSGPPQMTATTTIASFKCQSNMQQFQQQSTSGTICQTQTRASSL